ncbi:glycine betaine ABC transporter substrate-binding protein [uncultured Jatrophihabitans sp.]|uniref:glycine betaine ABC transporter substrate-binding protein n=1 Tax=uncultured Jatrophihabitans sp. TaxID=1610747 RepID=UPI0035CC5C8B
MTRTFTRLAVATAAAAASALLLSACGSSGSSSGGSGPSSSSGSSDTASAPAAKTGTIASKLILGGPPEFKTRVDGLPGLAKNYGVTFQKFTVTDVGGPITVNALKNGQVDAADLFTTDPSIKANNFVALADPKSNFNAQNVLPLIEKSKATAGVKQVLDFISSKLTTEALLDLDTQVQLNKVDPDKAARAYLQTLNPPTTTPAKGVTITVGSANFPENETLADIYADALSAAGATVSKKLNIGSREKYIPALQSGDINLIPEYSGVLLQYFDKTSTAASSADVFAALQKALPSKLEVLTQSQAQDKDAIVVTAATAAKYGLKSIADLAKTS